MNQFLVVSLMFAALTSTAEAKSKDRAKIGKEAAAEIRRISTFTSRDFGSPERAVLEAAKHQIESVYHDQINNQGMKVFRLKAELKAKGHGLRDYRVTADLAASRDSSKRDKIKLGKIVSETKKGRWQPSIPAFLLRSFRGD